MIGASTVAALTLALVRAMAISRAHRGIGHGEMLCLPLIQMLVMMEDSTSVNVPENARIRVLSVCSASWVILQAREIYNEDIDQGP